MDWKFSMVLLLVGMATQRAAALFCEDAADAFPGTYYVGYRPGTNTRKELTFGSNRITLDGEVFNCVEERSISPAFYIHVTLSNDQTQMTCFEFIQHSDQFMGLMRRVDGKSVDVSECEALMRDAASEYIYSPYTIIVQLVGGTFDNAFQQGNCGILEPLDSTDPTSSPFYRTTWSDGTLHCDTATESKVTQPEQPDQTPETMKFEVCDAPAANANYYKPFNGEVTCLGDYTGGSLNVDTTKVQATYSIVAYQDTVWTFYCLRVKRIRVGKDECVDYSWEALDRDEPKCTLVEPGTTTFFNEKTTWVDPGDPQKRFYAFRSCSTDCTDNRCKNLLDPVNDCLQDLGSFFCNCPSDTTGPTCDSPLNQCDSNPCQNGGQCFELAGVDVQGYECDCTTTQGFVGTHCERKKCIIPPEWWPITSFYQYGSAVDANDILDGTFADEKIKTDVEYFCEANIDNGSDQTFAVSITADPDKRRCVQIIEVRQLEADGVTKGDTFFLYRMSAIEAGTTSPLRINDCTQKFPTDEPFNVLFTLPPPNPVDKAPFTTSGSNQCYQVQWVYNTNDKSNMNCNGDPESQACINGNILDLSKVCQPNSVLNPFGVIGKQGTIYYTWTAPEMLNSASANGDVMLVAFPSDSGPPFYVCVRWTSETTSTPTIKLSFDLNNQLAPECRINSNSEQSTNNHMFIQMTSHECYINQQSTCLPGTCEDRTHQGENEPFTCNCQVPNNGQQSSVLGFTTERNRCVDIDECSTPHSTFGPCDLQGTVRCLNQQNAYECECREGWTSSDSRLICDVEDKCHNHQCRNGATCVADTSDSRGYSCTCVLGYTNGNARECEIDIDECLSQPCQNGGACFETAVGGGFMLDFYRCQCVNDFTGTNCEIEPNNCRPDTCKNGGKCINYPLGPDPGYYCDCRYATGGPLAGQNGRRKRETQPYSWESGGYIWQHCEHPNECVLDQGPTRCNPENTLYCLDRLDEKICVCKEGFVGGETADGHYNGNCDEADTDNPCYTKPCKNEGVCVADGDRFICLCAGTGFVGEVCDAVQLTCNDNRCPAGVACIDLRPSNDTFAYECDCPSGQSGRDCDDDDDGLSKVEQALIGLLIALVLACLILACCFCCAKYCPGYNPCNWCDQGNKV